MHLAYRTDGVVCTINVRHREVLVMDKPFADRRILVVEDEMMILLMIEEMLG